MYIYFILLSSSYVKMSSPNMNNVIIIGCIITYVEVLLLGANSHVVRPENYPALCVVSIEIVSC